MNKQYNYILLDWDGNIAQTLNLWPEALDLALIKRNIKLSREQLVKACSGVAKFLDANTELTEAEGRIVFQETVEIMGKCSLSVGLYPGAAETIRSLKNQEKRLALVTSSPSKIVWPVVRRYELDNFFDLVICAEDVKNLKPDPEMIDKALEGLKGVKEEAIIIGDTPKDINAAKNAGIDSVLFYPAENEEIHSLEEFMKHDPTYVIRNFCDLGRLVDGTLADI